MKSPVCRVLVASLVAALAALVGAGPALATGPSTRLRLAALQPAGVPVVGDDSAEALFTYRIEIDVLANDFDPEGGPLTIVGIESPPAFGTIDLTADNKIGYTPMVPLQQADQFTYRVADSNGASAVAQVTVSPYSQPVTVTPGKARIDIGGVPVGSYAVGRTRVTGPPVGAYGSIRFEAVDAADMPAAIAGTGYSLAEAVSDPQAFAQQGWFMTRADTSVADIYFRPSATVGRVSVARAVLSTPTNGAPAEASLIVLGRSVDPASMTPPRAVDDAAATPASTSLLVQALANDLDSSGRGMYVGTVWACDDPIDFVFASGPCNAVPGSAQLTYAPGALQPYAFTFTPNDGFLGATEVWYGMAEVEACMSPYQPGCALDSTIYMARASITANGVTLGVSKSGTGTGTVTSSSGISCGATCSVVLVPGTQVTLTATPDTGSTFAGWGGACSGAGACTLTVNTSATVSASFSSGPVNGPPYTLTVTPPAGGQIRAAGIRCGAGATLCAVTMPAAIQVGLEAVPSAGFTFSGWSGDCSGTTSAYLLALNGARTCGASFTPTSGGGSYSLTIAPTPTGGSVSGNGLACGNGGATCQVTFGSATPATLTATPASGYVFASWGGNCAGTSATTAVQVDAVKTCSATFTASGGGGGLPSGPPYTLTVTPPAGGQIRAAGIRCGAGDTQCAVTMAVPMSVGLEAVPSAGYTFAGWSGDCSGTAPAYLLALSGARTCGASFTPTSGGGSYSLTIAPAPTGGSVSGSGLACGAGGSACAVTFGSATPATLTASAASGYVFSAWGGACSGTNATTMVQVDTVKTCSATFTASGGGGGLPSGPPYTLTVTPPAGGQIRAAGIRCGAGTAACSITMPAAMQVGLEAVPSAGYTFAGWSGDCSGTAPTYLLALNGARTCSATFAGQ